MYVKVVNGEGSSKTEVTYPADHIGKTYRPDPDHDFDNDGPMPKCVGISVELAPVVFGNQSIFVEMPEDAHTIFQMNDEGATIDTIRWPENSSKEET